MIGLAKQLLGGAFNIATAGKGLSLSAKAGIGIAGAGFAARSIAGSNQLRQYEMGRYGRQEIEGRSSVGTLSGAIGTMGALAMVGGIGVGIGGGRLMGKAITSPFRGAMAMAKQANRVPFSINVTSKMSSRVGKRVYRPGKLPTRGVLATQGSKYERSKFISTKKSKNFFIRHPYITSAGIGAMAGIGGGALAIERRKRFPEGRITAIRSAPGGGIAPSLQYANVQSLFKRMHRNVSRIIK